MLRRSPFAACCALALLVTAGSARATVTHCSPGGLTLAGSPAVRVFVDGGSRLAACAAGSGTEDVTLAANNVFSATGVDVHGRLIAYNRDLGTTSLVLVRVVRITPAFTFVNSASVGNYPTIGRVQVSANGWMLYTACYSSKQETAPDDAPGPEPFRCRHGGGPGRVGLYVARPVVRRGVKYGPHPGVRVAFGENFDAYSLRLTGRTYTWRQDGRVHTGHLPA